MKIRIPVIFFLLTLFFLTVIIMSPYFGATGAEVGRDMQNQIFWNLRVPRTVLGAMAGIALAVAGMVFQAIFRNPLASPFTLGTASGAALGANLAILTGASSSSFILGENFSHDWFYNIFFYFPSFSLVTCSAFLGAILSLGLIFSVTHISRQRTGTDMLLAGVAVSFCLSSIIMMLQYISDPTEAVRMLRWTMGGLDSTTSTEIISLLGGCVFLGIAVTYWKCRELDLMCTGEMIATSRGVGVTHTRVILLTVMSLMIAAVVSVCGPIGFIGLMIPHIMRYLVGAQHYRLLPAVIMGGAVLLVGCDTIARTILAPDEIPVGVITALLGGPFFLAILMMRH